MLLMLGGRDRRVSPHQGLELYRALKSRAKPVRYSAVLSSAQSLCSGGLSSLSFVLFVPADCCGSQRMDTLCPEWTRRQTASSTWRCGCSSISECQISASITHTHTHNVFLINMINTSGQCSLHNVQQMVVSVCCNCFPFLQNSFH